MSRLLNEIDEKLRTESDIATRGELQAKKAAYLARVGRFDDSRAIIVGVREVFGDGRSASVTAFLMIAEGLIAHFENLGPAALDRIKRAQLIGDMTRNAEVGALASAWRAHLEFEASAFHSCAQSLRQSFALSANRNWSALARCSIVLFNAFAFAGNRAEAQKQFMKGREYALSEGDQASIDALVHSKAVFDVAHLWVLRCQGQENKELLKLARSELSSARNLQQLVGIGAHESFVDLSHARLLMLESEYAEALVVLEQVRSKGPFPSGHFSDPLVDAERAFCQARLGMVDRAIESFKSCRDASFTTLDVDDRLVVAWLVRELSLIDQAFREPSLAQANLESAVDQYRAEMQSVGAVFQEFADK